MGDAEGGIDLFSCVVAATAMLVTIVLSAFFSASEAALFSLTANQRQKQDILSCRLHSRRIFPGSMPRLR